MSNQLRPQPASMRIIGPRSNSKFPAGSTTVGSTKRLGRLRGGPCKHLLSHSAESAEKGYQSCHVEPFSHLLHPLSSASGSLGLFQLTPPHIAVVSTAVVSIAAAFTVVASTVVYVPEWR